MPQEYKHQRPQINRQNTRGYLLYILPAPLVIKLLYSILSVSMGKIVLTGAALFFFYSGAHLTRTTLLRIDENKKRQKPKKFRDYRPWAAAYIAIGIAIVMFMLKRPIPVTLLMTVCGIVGYYFTYGLRETSIAEPIKYDTMPKATREAIQGAFKDLEDIENLSKKLDRNNDKSIINNLEKVLDQSYNIMGLLVKSPNDAGRARRFLSVYTNRIKEILEQYLNLSQHNREGDFRERLSNVLAEANRSFSEKESKLLDDDKFKLDVQLEVLDEQIKHEKT